jgi:hypothetical protein
MSEVDVTKTGEDNSTIQSLRQHAKDLETQLKAKDDAIKDLERKEMDEKTRLSTERDEALEKAKDAESIRNELGQFQSKFEQMVAGELATVAEEQRPFVEKLLGNGTWADKYEALQAAKQLVASQHVPKQLGTITQPTGVGPVQPAPVTAQPFDLNRFKKEGLGSLLSQPRLGEKPPGA